MHPSSANHGGHTNWWKCDPDRQVGRTLFLFVAAVHQLALNSDAPIGCQSMDSPQHLKQTKFRDYQIYPLHSNQIFAAQLISIAMQNCMYNYVGPTYDVMIVFRLIYYVIHQNYVCFQWICMDFARFIVLEYSLNWCFGIELRRAKALAMVLQPNLSRHRGKIVIQPIDSRSSRIECVGFSDIFLV